MWRLSLGLKRCNHTLLAAYKDRTLNSTLFSKKTQKVVSIIPKGRGGATKNIRIHTYRNNTMHQDKKDVKIAQGHSHWAVGGGNRLPPKNMLRYVGH